MYTDPVFGILTSVCGIAVCLEAKWGVDLTIALSNSFNPILGL